MIAIKLMEGVSLTGDGSQEKPFLVTSVSDERDFLQLIEEKVESQCLLSVVGKHYDLLTTASGRLLTLMKKGDISRPLCATCSRAVLFYCLWQSLPQAIKYECETTSLAERR
ncbi:MAG: hypothetical protein NTW29_14505 [Bacteroidetes bacterium]|nr:hypothetical protein [Bacteroidota bacterium]